MKRQSISIICIYFDTGFIGIPMVPCGRPGGIRGIRGKGAQILEGGLEGNLEGLYFKAIGGPGKTDLDSWALWLLRYFQSVKGLRDSSEQEGYGSMKNLCS